MLEEVVCLKAITSTIGPTSQEKELTKSHGSVSLRGPRMIPFPGVRKALAQGVVGYTRGLDLVIHSRFKLCDPCMTILPHGVKIIGH